ncbi:MAG TPA: hypothetical protein VMY76_15255 [Gemmatimonadales bacterium]|nr:hypothetical protein [Gemmatimonadales bacterium]
MLRVEQALSDPDALATWHSALSSALSSDIPHDLLGLWLYPSHGPAVLLGPEALAQDELAPPIPAPQIQQAQLQALESVVRDAGYASVVALPIRSGRRDVGLVLAADLRASRYGDAERMVLETAALRLSPMLGRMARQWKGTAGATPQVARVAALVDAVARAGSQSGTPQLYLAELGRALETLLPHDHLELLVADAEGGTTYRLGEHAGGPLWADPSLAIPQDLLDIEALFGGEQTLLLSDTYHTPRWPRGYFTVEEPAGSELRSVVGARVRGPNDLTAYLLSGSVGADLYDDEDAALLKRVAGLIGAQVAMLVAAGMTPRHAPAAPSPESAGATAPAEPPSLLEAAELLATGTEFAETTRRVADLAARVLPFDEMRFAIRLSEGDRVVLLEPGERRPLPDLPLIPVAGTTLAAVLQGEIPHSFVLVDGEARLVVPLRVGGRVHGALVLTARHPAILRDVHIRPAQQLADVIASHLELLRRTALLPPPYLPGWKKVR